MREIPLTIPEHEHLRLDALYPATSKSWLIGARAVEIVQFYFRGLDPNFQFVAPPEGIDLRVVHNGVTEDIEVKGTAAQDMAWTQLKVSGSHSHRNLLAGTPLYRVVRVYNRDLMIYVMKYPEDFDIVPEARWTLTRR